MAPLAEAVAEAFAEGLAEAGVETELLVLLGFVVPCVQPAAKRPQSKAIAMG